MIIILAFLVTSNNQEGEYIVEKSYVEGIDSGDRIVSINGKSAEEYYDSIRNTKVKGDMKIVTESLKGEKHIASYGKENEIEPIEAIGITIKLLSDIDTAYIKVPAMNYDDQDQIKKFFKDNASAQNVIIDVRENRGGDPYISGLLAQHISKQPSGKAISAVIDGWSVQLKGKSSMDDFPYFWSSSHKPAEQFKLNYDVDKGNYDVFIEEIFIAAAGIESFNGDVYILQDEKCYSAGGTFLQIVRSCDFEAVTVGNRSGSTGASASKHIILPNSGLVLRVSNQMLVDENGNADEIVGLKPDYEVEKATAEAMSEFYAKNPGGFFFTSEYDPQFMKVMELIEQGEK